MWKKINYGSGRILKTKEFCNVDIAQIKTDDGRNLVDIVLDFEKEKLPFPDNSIEEVHADNVFEHLGDGFIFALNELHRVIKEGGVLSGCVPTAGSEIDFQDLTHKRHFIIKTFSYICGTGLALKNRPSHPRYADYGVLPWNEIELRQEGDLIFFKLSPRKV